MQLVQKTKSFQESKTEIQVKEIYSTPYEQIIECLIFSDSEPVNIDLWARSFSVQKFENTSVEKVSIHFYIFRNGYNSQNLHVSTDEKSKTWKEVVRGLSETGISEERIFLCTKVFERPTSARRKYDLGFQYDNVINAGNFSIIVKSESLQSETLIAVRDEFLCAYNRCFLVIHLNFPCFGEVEKRLKKWNLVREKDYFLVDTLNTPIALGEFRKIDDQLVIFLESQDKLQVINLH